MPHIRQEENDMLFGKEAFPEGKKGLPGHEDGRPLSGDALVRVIAADLEREGIIESAGDESSGRTHVLGTDINTLIRHILDIDARHRQKIRRRLQNEGIVAARERGVRFGRRAKPLPKNFANAVELWRKGVLNLSEAARVCDLPCSTFRYHVLNRTEAE